jgi:tRNA(adenine34) deaminase
LSSFFQSLSLPWQACLTEAWSAYCTDNVPIGAVVTGASGNILSRGRNHIYERFNTDGYISGTTLAHAEVNALIRLERHAPNHFQVNGQIIDPHTCILYTATEPCPLCMGAFYMSGLRELHYASRDPFAGSVNLLGTTPYLSHKRIRVFGPQNPILEQVIMTLYVDYALGAYGELAQPVFDAWQAAVPGSLEPGERLHSTGQLRHLRQEGLEAAVAIDWLVNYLAELRS